MCSNVYDDVTDCKDFGFIENTKAKYPEKETLFSVQISKFIPRTFKAVLFMWFHSKYCLPYFEN